MLTTLRSSPFAQSTSDFSATSGSEDCAAAMGAGIRGGVAAEMPGAAQPTYQPKDDTQPNSLQVVRILVVEDTPAVAKSMARLLEAMGHSVKVAQDGREGIQLVQDFQPQLVMSDLAMPQMNGFDFAHQIVHGDSFRPSLLVAVSGFGRDKDRRQAFQAGFDQFLLKPVGISELRDVISMASQPVPPQSR
jgi:CheY-like chemotaxis protein